MDAEVFPHELLYAEFGVGSAELDGPSTVGRQNQLFQTGLLKTQANVFFQRPSLPPPGEFAWVKLSRLHHSLSPLAANHIVLLAPIQSELLSHSTFPPTLELVATSP